MEKRRGEVERPSIAKQSRVVLYHPPPTPETRSLLTLSGGGGGGGAYRRTKVGYKGVCALCGIKGKARGGERLRRRGTRIAYKFILIFHSCYRV